MCLNLGWDGQILETEGVAVPEEVSCMLQVVSEYLKEACPITSLSGFQGPESVKRTRWDDEDKGRREVSSHTVVEERARVPYVHLFALFLQWDVFEYKYINPN